MWNTETLPLRGFIISPENASSFKLNEELWNLRPTSKQLFAAEGLDLLASILSCCSTCPFLFFGFFFGSLGLFQGLRSGSDLTRASRLRLNGGWGSGQKCHRPTLVTW